MAKKPIEIPIMLTTNVLFDTVTVTAEVEAESDLVQDVLEMIGLAEEEATQMAGAVLEFLSSEDVQCFVQEPKLEYGEYFMHVIVVIDVQEPEEHNKVERLLEEHEEFAEYLIDEA